MANNEGVKITITAEDRFTETIKKIEASTKIFGETAKNTEKHIAALEKEMIRLVANGMDPANKKIVEMKANYDKLNQSINTSGNSIKKNNQQWTNLALVVQDLPYGFRGIQNNLPALMGGFAKMTGPLYLAGSALIAFFAAYEMGLFDALTATNQFAEANKKAIQSVSKEATEIALLVGQYKNSNSTAAERKEIIEDLNRINPQYFGNLNKEKTSIDTLNSAYLAYVNNLGNVIKAKKLEEELTKKIEKRLQFEYEAGIDLLKSGYRNPELINQQNKALKTHNQMLQDEATLAERITSLSKVVIPTKTKAGKKGKDPILEAQIQEGKDIMYIADKFTKEFEDNEEEARKQREKNEEKAGKILISNRENINDALTAINKKFIKDDLDIIDANTKNALKANKGRYRAQLDIIRAAGVELQKERQKALELGADVAPIDKALQQNSDQLTAYGDRWKQTADVINNAIESMIESGITQFAENIGKAFAGEKVDLFDGFLTIIAEGFKVIGKALVAYGVAMEAFKEAFTNPYAAIAAGIALVAIGSFIGAKVGQMAAGGKGDNAKKFANGGIVSGPTYGLMGEYPGASSNPEVVAPLDKLKDMIGANGGGTLQTRISGNDLLILMNKANRNNTNTF